MDYILNGVGHGSVAKRFLASGGDPGTFRPWIGTDGRSYITVTRFNPAKGEYEPHNIVTNAPATLTQREWILLDRQIQDIARQRLNAWADLMARGLRVDIPNGMAKTSYQSQTSSDVSGAVTSMDGVRYSERDRPLYDYVGVPLPIIHKDFSFSLREILVSRNQGDQMGGGTSALDLSMGKLAGRKVAEEVEKYLLGVNSAYAYAGGSVYGYTNFPQRATKTMTAPTGTNPYTTLAEVIDMRTKLQAMNHFGPYVLYTSLSWDPFMDMDYVVSGGTVTTGTLRTRLEQITGLQDIKTMDYLPPKTMVLVQMDDTTVRGITGMGVTTLDWETHGGMELNFKVMCIMVPQLRADYAGNTGICHGTHP